MQPQPRDHVTTEELLAVTGSTRDTLYEWVARRLLPRPRVTTGPDGEQFAAWSPDTLERVRYIVDRLGEGVGMGDISAGVAERWPRR